MNTALDEWDQECIETPEQTEKRLTEIENKLAERLQLKDNVRQRLIALDKANQLVEDELVADWHECYSVFIHFHRQ